MPVSGQTGSAIGKSTAPSRHLFVFIDYFLIEIRMAGRLAANLEAEYQQMHYE